MLINLQVLEALGPLEVVWSMPLNWAMFRSDKTGQIFNNQHYGKLDFLEIIKINIYLSEIIIHENK